MAGKHDLYIYEIGGQFRVRPGTVAVDTTAGGGQPLKLKIRNVTNKEMVLVFPAKLTAANAVSLVLQGGEKNKDITILNTAPGGAYSYSVFTTESGKPVFASGESDPIIIVDD